MKLNKLTNLLLSHLQEEQSVQQKLCVLLEAQTAAAVAGDRDGLESTSSNVEAELAGETQREVRRKALMAAFGAELGIPAQMLTVGSLIERLEERGIATGALARVRSELKETLLSVRKLARKLRTLARGHGEVLRDVLCLLAGNDVATPGTGILVDAEV